MPDALVDVLDQLASVGVDKRSNIATINRIDAIIDYVTRDHEAVELDIEGSARLDLNGLDGHRRSDRRCDDAEADIRFDGIGGHVNVRRAVTNVRLDVVHRAIRDHP